MCHENRGTKTQERRDELALFRKKRLVTVSANKKYLNSLNVCCVPSARCHYLLLPGVNPSAMETLNQVEDVLTS